MMKICFDYYIMVKRVVFSAYGPSYSVVTKACRFHAELESTWCCFNHFFAPAREGKFIALLNYVQVIIGSSNFTSAR